MAAAPRACDEVSPIFLVGSPRSGTTLLRVMWNAHPNVIMPHECGFLHELFHRYAPLPSFSERDLDRFLDDVFAVKDFNELNLDREALRSRLLGLREPAYAHVLNGIYQEFAARHGKPAGRWGDKHTNFIAHMPKIAALFPRVKFIHIIRDSRGSVASLLRSRLGRFAFEDGSTYYPHLVVGASKLWRKLVARGRADGAFMGRQRYMEIKYEDLVLEPERICREMCTFVGEEFSEAMLDPARHKEGTYIPGHKAGRFHENIGKKLLTDRMTHWRKELSRPQLIVIEHLTGELMDSLGYERDIKQRRFGESARLAWTLALDPPAEIARNIWRHFMDLNPRPKR
jgi:hypothetical protein